MQVDRPRRAQERRSNASGEATRRLLLLTAERLFAERGLDRVSLREIGAAAGQRNTRVAQYHFGSKDGLVQAIFEHRLAGLEERRRARLDAIEAEGRTRDVPALVEALVLPLVEEVRSGSYYVRFLHQLSLHPLALHPWWRAPAEMVASAVRTRDLLAAATPAVPPALRAERFQLATATLVARLSRLGPEGLDGDGRGDALPFDVVVADLVDAVAALFQTEPSAATRAALRRRRRPAG